jgi:hypothetical protein
VNNIYPCFWIVITNQHYHILCEVIIIIIIIIIITIIIIRRSQWPRGLRRRSAAACLLRSWVRISPGAWIFVCCECCVLSVRGLCDELITRPEDSYRLWCVVVCDQETSRMRRPWPALNRSATKFNNFIIYNLSIISCVCDLLNLHIRPFKIFIPEFNLFSILLPNWVLSCGLPRVSKWNNEPSRSFIGEEYFGLLNDRLLKKDCAYLRRLSVTYSVLEVVWKEAAVAEFKVIYCIC